MADFASWGSNLDYSDDMLQELNRYSFKILDFIHYHATYLYFHLTISYLRPSDSLVRVSVLAIYRVLSALPKDHPLRLHILWPAFVAGLLAYTEEEKDTVLRCISAGHELGWINFQQAGCLLENVLAKREDTSESYVSWKDVIASADGLVVLI